MNDTEEKTRGYVYILEVKDIVLPVCKIGMTTRTPKERCAEINNSSTGDFIWEVAYQVAVNDCKKFESLVHNKLEPLRQKRREFFNINAEDAYNAVISIINSQSEIKEIIIDEMKVAQNPHSVEKTNKHIQMQGFRPIDLEYAELLQAFTSALNIKGRPFGQLNKPIFGISDGNEGVQWNIAVSTDTKIIRIGVNLEGMKYNHWPIAGFILSELQNPSIIKIKSKLTKPQEINIRFCRDAWQATSRPDIIEKFLGGREISFAELDFERWSLMLNEALGCLNKETNFRGRAKQLVTLENKPKNGEQVRLMEVSPHLIIWSPITLREDNIQNIKNKLDELQPVYDWITNCINTTP
ncbi:MAG: GIY-YIG nuclease family protein [Gammaproteobacteria bacterium]